jgi:colicin import membrane protein
MNIAAPVEPNQLVTIPKESALAVFTTDKAMDPFMARIREELDAFFPDISTVTGRKAVASMAYKVAQTKTYLEGVGKALADEQKEIPKKIDACRKNVRDTLDKWRDDVRKPLTDWEAAEEARTTAHTDAITSLNEISRTAAGRDSAGLKESLAQVEAVVIGPACEEFEADYARAKDAARASLNEEIPKAEKRETEAAELLALREQAAKRAEEDRIAAIQREAAEKATKAAEEEAQKTLDAEKAAAEKAQRDADAKVAQAQADAEAAEKRAAETEARLKKEAEEKAAAEETTRVGREADKEHRKAINRAALTAFVEGGLSVEAATQAVILIATRAIPAVTIFY